MAKNIANVVIATDSFATWVSVTNQTADAFTKNALTANAAPGGAVVTGNSHLFGIFAANTIVANNSLRGGNVSHSNLLTISSNTNFTGEVVNSAANVYIGAANVYINTTSFVVLGVSTLTGNATFKINATNTNIQLLGNATASNLTFSANAVSIVGNVSITNATSVANTVAVTGAATLSNTIAVTGNATFSNVMLVTGAATLSNTIAVIGNATFSNTMAVTGAATFSNTIAVTNNATFSNTMAVTGAATFSNTIAVTNNATFSNTMAVTGAATFSNTIAVTGNATFSNTLGVTGAATFSNTVAVTNNATFSNTIAVTGAANLASTLGVVGAANLASTLGVTGAANLASTLGVTGAANLASTLGVVGAATLSNTIAVTGNATFSNTIAVTGNATFSNTIAVTGAANLASTLGVIGAATLSNTIAVTGAANLASTLGVVGAATLSNTIAVTGAANLASTLGVLGNVWVTSTIATFNSNTGVANTTDFITSTSAHGFANGEYVQYIVSAGNTAVTGLVNASFYYVVGANATAFQLASTVDGANINITAGLTQTGHSLQPIRIALSTSGKIFANTIAVTGAATLSSTLGVGGNVTFSGTHHLIAGNVTFDTDLLFLDATNNRIGLKNNSPSSVDLVTVGGNVVFNAANTTGLRFITATAGVNSSIVLMANTSNSRLTFATYDNSNTTVNDGGFLFNFVNSTATTAGVLLTSNTFHYKGANVTHAGNFGIYNVSGTRVGP